jgi:hypothetical protein
MKNLSKPFKNSSNSLIGTAKKSFPEIFISKVRT